MSDADLLHRAAARMRELAEAADGNTGWTFSPGRDGMQGDPGSPALIAHIESWSPTVALAVADWLESEADRFDGPTIAGGNRAAVVVARAFLREGGETP